MNRLLVGVVVFIVAAVVYGLVSYVRKNGALDLLAGGFIVGSLAFLSVFTWVGLRGEA